MKALAVPIPWPAWLRRQRLPPRIAPVSADHADRLAEIHGSAFARPWSAEDFEAFLAERSIRAEGIFLDRDRQPCGFILTRVAADEAEILSVAVARPARGMGRARTLLAQHLARLAHEGIGEVHLEVEEGNLPALALYRGLGFREVGRRPGYYVKPDGTRACAITMTRRA
jgi:ribosomal-protein-alanine N-acetyltransferase